MKRKKRQPKYKIPAGEYRSVYMLAGDREYGPMTPLAWSLIKSYRVRPARYMGEVCGLLVGRVLKRSDYPENERKRYVFMQTRGACTLPE